MSYRVWEGPEPKLHKCVHGFDRMCGILCSHLRFKNNHPSEIDDVKSAFYTAIELGYKTSREALQKSLLQDNSREHFLRVCHSSLELKRLYNFWRYSAVIGVKQYRHRVSMRNVIDEP